MTIFYSTLRLFADVVGAQERCEDVIAYLEECRTDLEQRTGRNPEEEKQRVYTGAVTFNGRHGFAFTYVNFPPFAAIGAKQCGGCVFGVRDRRSRAGGRAVRHSLRWPERL